MSEMQLDFLNFKKQKFIVEIKDEKEVESILSPSKVKLLRESGKSGQAQAQTVEELDLNQAE
jgi:hypothetical protein